MIVEVLALVTFSAFLLFWLARRKNGYWIRRGIAGPQPVPFKGNMDQTFGKSPAVFQLQKWTRQYGKVFGFQDGWFHVLVTSDPEILRELLVDKFEYFHSRLISPAAGDLDHTNEINVFSAKGKRWKRLRAISNPAFSVANLKKVMPTIDDSIQVTMRLLQEASLGSDKAVNMHPYLTEMTLDVIARLALGQQESQQFRSEYCKLAVESFEQFGNSVYDWISMQFPWLGRNMVHPFLHFVGWMIGDPLSIIQKKVAEVVRERRRQRDNNNKMDQGTGADEEVEDVNARKKPVVDFIDLFLDCISEDYQLSDQSGVFNKLEKFERKLKPEEVVANCIVFMLAGFDTTANSLSIVCHLLALNPEAQERLHEEVDYICPDPEEPPTYEQLSQLKYTEAVVKETLRLYPVASAVVTRVCAETTTLGGYTVEKGTVIKADLLTLHRDKQLWGPDADLFRPERWLDGAEAPPNAYYPFGGGPRICIGMRLAMLEEKMALVHLMRRFRLLKCAETEMELKLTGQVVLNPRAIHVKLEQRSSTHN